MNRPILIVCYTNHALDQFLDGIRKFCEKVGRVGGKLSSKTKLSEQKVVGMTTTGAAKYRHLIESLAPQIVGELPQTYDNKLSQ